MTHRVCRFVGRVVIRPTNSLLFSTRRMVPGASACDTSTSSRSLALGGLAFHDLAQGLVDPRLPAAPRRFEIFDHLGADAQRHQLPGRRFARAASPADRCGEIGEDLSDGRALAKSAFVSSGLSLTARRSFAPYPAFLLALFIKFSFLRGWRAACYGSACTARKSTSLPSWPAKGSASRKSTTAFGSSASCIMIWDIRPGAENPATPRQPVRHEVVTHVLGTYCYLCVRAGHCVEWRATADEDGHYSFAVPL